MDFSYATTGGSSDFADGYLASGSFVRGNKSAGRAQQSTSREEPTTRKRQDLGAGKRLQIISPAQNADKAVAALNGSFEALFASLAERWRNETKHISSPTEVAMHPAYQRIIGLGPRALPLIIKELSTRPDWWFWALRAISGVDPVQESERGRLGRMVESWLAWWESSGRSVYAGEAVES